MVESIYFVKHRTCFTSFHSEMTVTQKLTSRLAVTCVTVMLCNVRLMCPVMRNWERSLLTTLSSGSGSIMMVLVHGLQDTLAPRCYSLFLHE